MTRPIRRFFFALCLLVSPLMAAAQTAPAQTAPAPPAREPAIRRWLEVQTLTLSTRYRFVESNTHVVSSNDLQYREVVRARVNLDTKKRFGVGLGAQTGSNFIGAWNNTGLGINDGNYRQHYLRELFLSATPIVGVEGQVGGLFPLRGEATEFTTFDDDGYVLGERISIRRPKQLFFDEISATRALAGPTAKPNLFDRFELFDEPQYTQLLGIKRFNPRLTMSFDYSRLAGADVLHLAATVRLPAKAPLSLIRVEQYYRFNASAAGGVAITLERPVTRFARLQAGYATIDERYGNLNADRFLRGRRFFAIGNVPIHGSLSAAFFATQALDASYSISNRRRYDAILQWDVLAAMRARRLL